MGFFSSLWSGVKKVAETAVTIAAAPIIIPAALAYGAYDSLTNSTTEASEKISEVGKLTETSSVSQVQKIHEILTFSNDEYVKKAEEKEKAYQKYINDCFNQIILVLKQDETIAKNFNMENLLFEQKNLCRQMRGVITRRIHSDLTLDNIQIREIMAISNSSERKKRYKEYADKTIKNAADNAANKCEQALNIQMDQIDDFLQDYVERKNWEAERMKSKFAEIEDAMQCKTFDADKASLTPMIRLYAVDTIERIFVI